MKRVLAFVIPFFIVLGVCEVLGALVAGYNIMDLGTPATEGQTLIIKLFEVTGVSFLLWGFMRIVDNEPFINLGYSIRGRFKDIVAGNVVGAGLIAVGFFFLIFMEEITYEGFSFSTKEFMTSVGVYILVAVLEESVFRGYVLRNLMRSYNKYVALVISSLLFALIHAVNPNISWFSMLDLFLAGIALGISYIYTKNLWFPIAFHFSWNFVQSHLGFNVSGQDFYSVIHTSFSSETLLNGGAFGFEGSILSIIAEVLTIILVMYYYNRYKVKKAIA